MAASAAKPATRTTDSVPPHLAAVWHPCTQMREHHQDQLPLIPIRRGDGVWLEDFEGRRYLDAISSWWTNLFGHAHPRIAQAIADQASRLEHVLLAGFSHAPAIELAERLLARAPNGLSKVFYADNGSAATADAEFIELAFILAKYQPGGFIFTLRLEFERRRRFKFCGRCAAADHHRRNLGIKQRYG